VKTIAGVLILAALICGSGCARSDWIERTLVTVDVTGTWYGSIPGGSNSTGDLWFDLEQQGSTVKGFMQLNLIGGARPGYGSLPRPIDGTVAGDVFRFKEKAGAVEGELTVSGDEMTGQAWITGIRSISLRRVDPSSHPRR
jgi:hypothetical protein